jgi:hypothetical protein
MEQSFLSAKAQNLRLTLLNACGDTDSYLSLNETPGDGKKSPLQLHPIHSSEVRWTNVTMKTLWKCNPGAQPRSAVKVNV